MICALLVFQTPDLPAPLTTLSPWMDMLIRPVSQVHAQLDAQLHRRFVKTHTPLDGLPVQPQATYIVVGRDPRDIAVSLRHQGANLDRDVIARLLHGSVPESGSQQLASKAATEREGLLRWMNSDDSPLQNLDTLRGLVWQLERAWSRRHEPNVVLLHYSDLSRDLEGEMRRLAARLDIDVPEATWPALVEAATFEAMREQAADRVPDERAGIMKDPRKFFRRGGSGEWGEWLTDDDLAGYDGRVAALAPPDLVHWLHHGSRG